MKNRFTSSQQKIIWGCLLLYSTAYLNRLNLAAALGSVISAFSLTTAQAGWLPTAFAVVYAVGQMVNGALVDRLDPVKHMSIGLTGSAVCNVLMGCSPSYGMLVALCLINGAFQSMLWTPIVRLIALHFEQEKRKKANFMVSVTLIIGHLGAWALSGYLSGILSWRASFIAPGVLVVPVLLAVLWMFRTADMTRGGEKTQKKASAQTSLSAMLRVFGRSGFFAVLLASITHGFVRDGISNWAPTILGGLGENALNATTFSLIIPMVNACGMLISYVIQEKSTLRNRKLMAMLLMLSAVFCALLTSGRNMLVTALLMGLGCACYSGNAPIINTLIPLEYEPEKLIGLTAGVIDATIYLGSALAGVCGGLMTEAFGLNALYITWAVTALIGGAAMFLADAMMVRYRREK